MSTHSIKTKIGVAAGIVAGSAGLALVAGLGPAPSLLSTASAGSGDTTTSTVDATATTSGAPIAATRAVDAGPAGSLQVAETGGRLELVGTSPAAGWSVEVERAAGREVEVDFRKGSERVQVDVELEDGTVRERVRYRDDATGTRIELSDGNAVRTGDDGPSGSAGRGDDDHGDDTRHDEGDDDHDDRGGDTRDDDHDDDHDGSGHGSDDPPGDDHGGRD